MTKNRTEMWEDEKKAVKATQVAFDISTEAQKKLKLIATHNGLSPSDQMREILGLPRKKPIRPRLTISLTTRDYELLAEMYDIDASDKLAIKEIAAKQIIQYVMTAETQSGDTEDS